MCKCKEKRTIKKGKDYIIVACSHELLLEMKIEDECDSSESR